MKQLVTSVNLKQLLINKLIFKLRVKASIASSMSKTEVKKKYQIPNIKKNICYLHGMMTFECIKLTRNILNEKA